MQISVTELEEVRDTYAELGRKLMRGQFEQAISNFCHCEPRKVCYCTCEVRVQELLALIKGENK